MERKTLDEFLSKTNAELLSDFKWGNQGESDFGQFMNLVRELVKEEDKDYRQMVKSFIGETIKDFFCNGFFGSRNFYMEGAEITKIYDSDDDNAVVVEVRKLDGKRDYGYFEDGWRDWKSVYEHLEVWTKGETEV